MSDPTAKTIVAISTPAGPGAVSMIRLSGPRAVDIADVATSGFATGRQARSAGHCRVIAAAGEPLDDGLLTVFPAPHSYTGETCIEFTGHGGVLVTREVLNRFLECGATLAEPGEFTKRAFLNGRLDLTQAEGVMDLISAQTRLSLRAARAQLDGHLGRKTTTIRDEILHILAHLEAWIDFPDEDIDPQTGAALHTRISAAENAIHRLLATAEQGRILREGVRTVIFGAPNVGKSSLLNQLLGFERAIVSEIAGTTRDTIEESINFHGIPLRLIDTAGVRDDTTDVIEAEGISRTLQQIGEAGLLIEVMDGSMPRPPSRFEAARPAHHVMVLNKADLPEHPSWHGAPAVRISCATGSGFNEFSQIVRDCLHISETDWGEHAIAINARHQNSLRNAREALEAALDLLGKSDLDPGLAAIELREALDALGEISGRVDTEDLLSVIFSSFCIGK
ncbi:MAG: tRNA uridine-5-carboxymethylaminomethyl(34) synthesis GTPase MnmE [Verrucomicrobiota bacterium]